MMLKLQSALRVLFLVTIGASALSPRTANADSPAEEAVGRLGEARTYDDVVQNRFFIKENRFEIAPVLGYVPNNPFAKRYIGGLQLAYHISESFAAEGAILYSPDLAQNDLKGLTSTLVQIAAQSDGDFQQPIDKMILGATFAARWAPVYGKINLLGERVLNFDFYGTGGVGLLSLAHYYATYNSDASEGESIVALSTPESKYTIPLNLGVGFNFFLSQSIALKIDLRDYLYVGPKPDYDPDDDSELGSRVYNTVIATVGVSIFVPKMKPRLYDF